MDDDFDPYHKWLGIPPAEQPPDHYRLLGLSVFESDPAVIESSADRQMTHVRTFQTGQHSSKSQHLLNAISAARLCLLKPDRKAKYDRELRVRQEARKIPDQTLAPVRAIPAPPVAMAVPANLPPNIFDPPIPSVSVEPQQRALAPPQKKLPLIPVALAVTAALVLTIFVFSRSTKPTPGPVALEDRRETWPAGDVLPPVVEESGNPVAATSHEIQVKSPEDEIASGVTDEPETMALDPDESMPSEDEVNESHVIQPEATSTSDSDDDAPIPDDSSEEPEKSSPTPTKTPKKPSTPKRPGHIPKEAIFWNGSWYLFSEKKASFDEAFAVARRFKGRLLIIKSQEENSFVTSHIKGPTWLGLKKQSGRWINVLGRPQQFFDWQPGQPQNGKNEDFAAIHPNGLWHDYLKDKLYFCVEWGLE